MSDWAVIPASLRDQVLETMARPIIRATALPPVAELRQWADDNGIPHRCRNLQPLVDAYLTARYTEATNAE